MQPCLCSRLHVGDMSLVSLPLTQELVPTSDSERPHTDLIRATIILSYLHRPSTTTCSSHSLLSPSSSSSLPRNQPRAQVPFIALAPAGPSTRPTTLVASPALAASRNSECCLCWIVPLVPPFLTFPLFVRTFLSSLVIAISTLLYHTTPVRCHQQPTATSQRAHVGRRSRPVTVYTHTVSTKNTYYPRVTPEKVRFVLDCLRSFV
jgi:hypothetical protein